MKVLTCIALCLLSFSSFAVDATHGMVLFGHQKLMAYHLPMFHKIHAHQVVIEYSVPELVKNKILESYGLNNLLTFVPAPFDLEEFLIHPHSLTGDIYLGHFEKDGVVIMSDITLETPKIIYQGGLTKESGSTDSYKLFGTPSDLFLVHLLNGGKQMDQIIQANVEDWPINNGTLTQKAINEGTELKNFGLLKPNDVGSISFTENLDFKNDWKCYPLVTRACDFSKYELQITAVRDYFLDSVM